MMPENACAETYFPHSSTPTISIRYILTKNPITKPKIEPKTPQFACLSINPIILIYYSI